MRKDTTFRVAFLILLIATIGAVFMGGFLAAGGNLAGAEYMKDMAGSLAIATGILGMYIFFFS